MHTHVQHSTEYFFYKHGLFCSTSTFLWKKFSTLKYILRICLQYKKIESWNASFYGCSNVAELFEKIVTFLRKKVYIFFTKTVFFSQVFYSHRIIYLQKIFVSHLKKIHSVKKISFCKKKFILEKIFHYVKKNCSVFFFFFQFSFAANEQV